MDINIRDYTYELPPDRIAAFPLKERDESKLLVYRKGSITHDQFAGLPGHLPENTTLFFNNTKVIQARLHFEKESGALIEVFLLQPVFPGPLLLQAMQSTTMCTWKCTIGNLKRWKHGTVLTKQTGAMVLHAELADRAEGIVQFTWSGGFSFAEVVEGLGKTPLPPYLKREASQEDKLRYQTVYSREEGAVAAPTAGLHFTPRVLGGLEEKGILQQFLTLHVSAGTFQPVKVENAAEHVMHREQIVITRENIIALLDQARFCVAVGTTTMRSLESVYWYGVHLEGNDSASFDISQRDAYTLRSDISSERSLRNVLERMKRDRSEVLVGNTSIYIMPGYRFRICRGLITNFHQPGSTLILLVAAFIGENWRSVYREAMNNQYRFLSYGDSSLLLP